MTRVLYFAFIGILVPLSLTSQTLSLSISADIKLLKDSIVSARLISDLSNFLIAAQQDNSENKWILTSEKSETSILTQEIRSIYQKDKNNDSLKPYLTNVVPIDNNKYLIQLSYLGIKENKPFLQASFDIVATDINTAFRFSSTLSGNSANWKSLTKDYITVYYQDSIESFITQYIKYIQEFDAKLNLAKPSVSYFCSDCETLPQLLQLSGIQYQLDYNGLSWSMTNFETPEKIINFYTKRFYFQKNIDPHDMFHARAALAIPENKRNHYMICGCAYVYGGSWGITWHDIQKMFKSNMSYDDRTDWKKLYFERYNFGESKEKHLLVTQFVNALIIQQTEKEKGFSGVIQLLESGNMYKDRTNFFKTLEDVTGINEKNFNKTVGKLVNNAMNNI